MIVMSHVYIYKFHTEYTGYLGFQNELQYSKIQHPACINQNQYPNIYSTWQRHKSNFLSAEKAKRTSSSYKVVLLAFSDLKYDSHVYID